MSKDILPSALSSHKGSLYVLDNKNRGHSSLKVIRNVLFYIANMTSYELSVI